MLDQDGQYIQLEKVELPETLGDESQTALDFSELQTSFQYVGRGFEKLLASLLGLNKAVVNACPNKTVRWLAAHAKKQRVRTKNANRAFWILERYSQFVYVRHGSIDFDGTDKPIAWNLHMDELHQMIAEDCGRCNDFHCFRAKEK